MSVPVTRPKPDLGTPGLTDLHEGMTTKHLEDALTKTEKTVADAKKVAQPAPQDSSPKSSKV